jgi:hypothetical protein
MQEKNRQGEAGREIRELPRGSLVFGTEKEAEKFGERVQERLAETAETGKENAARKAIRQELAEHTGGVLGEEELPREWRYSPEDREKVQQYVNMAFEQNLAAAVGALLHDLDRKEVDRSERLRTLDLFHDTLVDYLYHAMLQRGLIKP